MKKLAALVGLTLLGAAPAGVEIRGLRHPALSPDGTRIAFDWHGDLWICPVEGGVAEHVTTDPADEQKPCWSPDGQKLAYSSDKNGNRDLFVIDLRTRRVRQVTSHSADDDAPAWSPDGAWIAFQSNRDSNLDLALNNNVWDLWKVPAEGGTATRITRFRGENPAWSPDGKFIAYDRYSSGYADGEHNLFVVASDGSGVPREIAAGGEDSRRPVFRGNQIFFAHEANGIKQSSSHRNVWRTVLAGGPLLQVTGHLDNEVTWPTTAAKANVLVYERDFSLYSIDPRVQQPKPQKLMITAEGRFEEKEEPRTFTSGFRSPAWSPSGARVAFVCRGQIWTAAADGSEVRPVTRGVDDHRDPSWTPDGRLVYVRATVGAASHVVISDADGGNARALTKDAAEYRRPRMGPGGTRVYAITDQGGSGEVWEIEVKSGDSRRVLDAEDFSLSPDGTLVACLKRVEGRSSVLISDFGGKTVKEIKSSRTNKFDVTWSPDGTRLAWAESNSEGRGIRIHEIEGGAEQTVSLNGRHPSWSPDSTMMIVEQERPQTPDSQSLVIVDAKGSGKLPLEIRATRAVTRREEMTGVFLQVWSAYQSNYYDPFFHGVDWTAIREKYRPLADECQTPAELYDLINDMIKELRSSHVHLTPAPLKNTVTTGSLAADVARNSDGTLRVVRIEPNGPADKSGLREGDILLAAGGVDFTPATDLDAILSTEPNGTLPEVRFTVKSGAETREVAIRGIDRVALRELKYENRIAARKKLVRERSGGRLAYHHIKMMVQAEVTRLKSTLDGEAADAEGLVLDERDGVGGLAHKPICALLDSTAPDRLNAQPACHTRNRNGTTAPDVYGNGAQGGRIGGKSWDKPVILVQNEISRSDKEILPFTFRYLGIGYLVGMPTAGGVIGGNDWTMRDGSKITVSTQGWFSADGRNLEGYGVPPDFRAPETHEDLLAGRDAALEKAIEVLLAQMDGKIAPPKKPGGDRKNEGH